MFLHLQNIFSQIKIIVLSFTFSAVTARVHTPFDHSLPCYGLEISSLLLTSCLFFINVFYALTKCSSSNTFASAFLCDEAQQYFLFLSYLNSSRNPFQQYYSKNPLHKRERSCRVGPILPLPCLKSPGTLTSLAPFKQIKS